MPKPSRRPSRAEVARALRDLKLLWTPPDKNDTADPERNPESAAEQIKHKFDSTPTRGQRKGAA